MGWIDWVAIKVHRTIVPAILLDLLHPAVTGRAQRLQLAHEQLKVASMWDHVVRYRGSLDPAEPRAVPAEWFGHQ